jgi:cobyrinic acid a,c-diamide synthase
MDTTRGLIIAAPASGSGKTMITLGLLAACRAQGLAVAPAKVGPDYIDPAFHAAASGRVGATLDAWAMSPATLGRYVNRAGASAAMILCEGVMGLLDGAAVPPGQADGSTADIARLTGWPVVMVVDCKGMAASAAAIVAGFAAVVPAGTVAGVIFNRVGSAKHRAMIETAMARHQPAMAILGYVPPLADLTVPSRHLGLVQAVEHPDLAGFLDKAGAHMAHHIDIGRLCALARPHRLPDTAADRLPPLGTRIAVARDPAFAFAYPDILADWRDQGAEISFFSPLDDQPPDSACDAVYLPGGYPELHAPRLAAPPLAAPPLAAGCGFLDGLRGAARRGAVVYGECGGYMVLGQAIIDAHGQAHAMAGLLPAVTSFETPERHLGYRQAVLRADHPFGSIGRKFRGHEFHFARELTGDGEAMWDIRDAAGLSSGHAGYRSGSVSGSFIHLISVY